MRDRLRGVMEKHAIGIPAGAISAYELCDVLEAHLAAQDKQSNELLGYLASIRACVLDTIWDLDVGEYYGLLEACVDDIGEVVRAVETLKKLVVDN